MATATSGKAETKRFAHLLDSEPTLGGILPLPLVGRIAELNQLARFLANSGDSSILQLVGLRGVGRTRLAREACHTLERAVVYVTDADPTGLAAPFYPIRALVAGILDLPPVTDYTGLEEAIFAIGLGDRDVPGIGELFGIDGKLRKLEANVRRRELLVSTTRVLAAAAGDRRAVLLFRNVDRYDHPSQDVLRRLAEGQPSDNLRVVVTNGPDFASRWPSNVERINVPVLEGDQIDEIARHLHKFDSALPDADQLGQCGGSPSHMEHLVRFVIEGGAAAEAPSGLADLIASRLDAMPRLTAQVCQALAIFGSEVGESILRGTLALRVTEEQFADSLRLLETRGLISSSDGHVQFREQLARDVVYEATPVNVRRELHAAAVAVLRQHTGDEAVLGHHYDLAGELDRGAPLLSSAGDAAVDQLDESGACILYNRALAAARRLVLGDDTSGHRSLFVKTSIKLADALRVGGQLGLANGLLAEADHYCRDSPDLRARLLSAAAHLYSTEGAPDKAVDTTRDAIGYAITTGDRELLSRLYLDLSTMCLRSGEVARAIGELEEGVDLVTAGDGATASDGPQILWRMLLRLSQLYASSGGRERAIELGYNALQHADRVFSDLGAARSQAVLAVQLERLGEVEKAVALREDAVKRMRDLGDRRGTAELLLAGVRPSHTINRGNSNAASLTEAKVLAEEVGWAEGVRRASESSPD